MPRDSKNFPIQGQAAWPAQLPPREFIDGVDVVDPFALGAIAMVRGIDAQKARLALGTGFFIRRSGSRWAKKVARAEAAAWPVAQVLEAVVGQCCEEPGKHGGPNIRHSGFHISASSRICKSRRDCSQPIQKQLNISMLQQSTVQRLGN
jgi:hypothetical protein